MISLSKINTILSNMNDRIYDQIEDSEIYIKLTSIGNDQHIIEFLGIRLWSYADDDRMEIEEGVYEELEPFLYDKVDEVIRTVMTLDIFKDS